MLALDSVLGASHEPTFESIPITLDFPWAAQENLDRWSTWAASRFQSRSPCVGLATPRPTNKAREGQLDGPLH